MALKLGDAVLIDGEVWLVTNVSASGVYIHAVYGRRAEIKTRRRKVNGVWQQDAKTIYRRPPYRVIALQAQVAVYDSRLIPTALRRRIMAEGQAGVVDAAAETQGAQAAAPAPRLNQRYQRTTKELKKPMQGQGKVVYDEMGTEPITVAALSQLVGPKIVTRQPVERVVGFYLSKFKRDGLVKAVGAEQPADASATA